jgi:hypothetical protein
MRTCPSTSAAALLMSTPISRIRSVCCARAASGSAAAPPMSVMKSRRLMGSLSPRITPYHIAVGMPPCDHNKIDRRMAEVGQLRLRPSEPMATACPQWGPEADMGFPFIAVLVPGREIAELVRAMKALARNH